MPAKTTDEKINHQVSNKQVTNMQMDRRQTRVEVFARQTVASVILLANTDEWKNQSDVRLSDSIEPCAH